MSWKGAEFGAQATLIDQALKINQQMPAYVVSRLQQRLPKPLKDAKILILGVAFKKDINGLQESASVKLLELLPHADFHDPYIEKVGKKVRVKLNPQAYDAVIIATDHSLYDFASIVEQSQLVVDTRNATRGLPQNKVVKA